MKKFNLKLLYFLFSISTIYCQNTVQFDNSSKKMQYGVSTRLVFDVGKKNYNNIRIGFASGMGFNFYTTSTTSLNVEYSILYGGLGTYNNKNSSYFVIAPHFCQSLHKNNFVVAEEALNYNQPLYYFTDLVTPPLQNQFRKSVSIGANFVYFLNERMKHRWQRVAHFGIKYEEAQLIYNNDGGAFLKYWGDKEDRSFTGIGFLRVRLKDYVAINDLAISFYKFTGYNYMSFEAGDELLYSSVDYKDPQQNLFNRGFWSFQVGNSKYGDVFMRYNNPRNTKEVQNFIHYTMGFGYHQNPTDSFYTFGGSLNQYQTNIPGK